MNRHHGAQMNDRRMPTYSLSETPEKFPIPLTSEFPENQKANTAQVKMNLIEVTPD